MTDPRDPPPRLTPEEVLHLAAQVGLDLPEPCVAGAIDNLAQLAAHAARLRQAPGA